MGLVEVFKLLEQATEAKTKYSTTCSKGLEANSSLFASRRNYLIFVIPLLSYLPPSSLWGTAPPF
jgi:hypothetical protein